MQVAQWHDMRRRGAADDAIGERRLARQQQTLVAGDEGALVCKKAQSLHSNGRARRGLAAKRIAGNNMIWRCIARLLLLSLSSGAAATATFAPDKFRRRRRRLTPHSRAAFAAAAAAAIHAGGSLLLRAAECAARRQRARAATAERTGAPGLGFIAPACRRCTRN